jgi:hypothetical protein
MSNLRSTLKEYGYSEELLDSTVDKHYSLKFGSQSIPVVSRITNLENLVLSDIEPTDSQNIVISYPKKIKGKHQGHAVR